MMKITNIEKDHILNNLKEEKRRDNRELKEYREIEIKRNVAKNSEGSAQVNLGKTKVIASVKADIGTPFPDSPDAGILMVNVELRPTASPSFELGPPGEQATELARVVDRGIRESEIIDFDELCIESGEKVWKIMIDINPLDDCGNLMDASALAAAVALEEAHMPGYDEETEQVIRDEENEFKIKELPLACTVYKAGSKLFVDPSSQEEEISDSAITVTWVGDNLCSLQKRGNGGIKPKELKKSLEIARDKTKELKSKIKSGE